MPNGERPPAFLFYPRDFLTDRVVASMTPEELGGYVPLLCHAWLSDKPGILPDDDALLARLSGLGERWKACRSAIRSAFAQRGNELVQKRMVQEREAQLRRRERHVAGAIATNEIRRSANAQRTPSDTPSARIAFAVASASSVASPDSDSNSQKGRVKSTVDARRPPFVKPTLEEVETYCAERKALNRPAPDPEAWFDHYTANGWRVGKNPMKDWRAAVRQWERNPLSTNGNGHVGNGRVPPMNPEELKQRMGLACDEHSSYYDPREWCRLNRLRHEPYPVPAKWRQLDAEIA